MQIEIIGMGNIGRILVKHLLIGCATARRIVVVYADESRAQSTAAEFGVTAAALEDEIVAAADVLLLSPSPKAVPEVLQILAPRLRAGQIVVSFAAAISLERLEKLVPAGVVVVRFMPNTTSLVGRGLNPIAFGTRADDATGKGIRVLLECLGETIEVRDEQMNWCVGLSWATMRSLLPALEGMTQAGIEAGLSEQEARCH